MFHHSERAQEGNARIMVLTAFTSRRTWIAILNRFLAPSMSLLLNAPTAGITACSIVALYGYITSNPYIPPLEICGSFHCERNKYKVKLHTSWKWICWHLDLRLQIMWEFITWLTNYNFLFFICLWMCFCNHKIKLVGTKIHSFTM